MAASTPVWHDINISQFKDPIELAPVLKVLQVRMCCSRCSTCVFLAAASFPSARALLVGIMSCVSLGSGRYKQQALHTR